MWANFTHANPIAITVAPATVPLILFFTSTHFDPFSYIVFAVVAYIGMLLLGVPAINYLGAREKLTTIWLLAAGVCIGCLLGLLYGSIIIVLSSGQFFSVLIFPFTWIGLIAICVGALCGLATSIVYLLIDYFIRHKSPHNKVTNPTRDT